MRKQELFDLKSINKRVYEETSGTYATFKCDFVYEVDFGNLYITFASGFKIWLYPVAVLCNATTNFEIQLYDYRPYLERKMLENQSYSQMLDDIKNYPPMCANCLFLKNMTIEEAQKIIDDNMLAFHKFNEYIAEQKLIEQINNV